MSQQEADVARAFAQGVSSKAVPVTTMQARIWLFGGCALEPEINAYLNGVAAANGYDREVDYDREKFMSFMTPIVGTLVASAAADIVEEGM